MSHDGPADGSVDGITKVIQCVSQEWTKRFNGLASTHRKLIKMCMAGLAVVHGERGEVIEKDKDILVVLWRCETLVPRLWHFQ